MTGPRFECFESVVRAERRATLAAYAETLGREAHHLARDPQLLWQQLHNRLQWGGDAVRAILEPERERRAQGTGRWLWTRTPLSESKALQRTLTLPPRADARAVAVSPAGGRIAGAGQDGRVRLWSAETGRLLHGLDCDLSSVAAVAFSPDGTTLASAGWSNAVWLWDVESGAPAGRLPTERWISSLAFAPDGSSVWVGSDRGEIWCWDTTHEELAVTISPSHTCVIEWISISSDTRFVAASHSCGLLEVAEPGPERFSTLPERAERGQKVRAVFSSDGVSLAKTSLEWTAEIRDATDGTLKHELKGHRAPVTALAFSDDAASLATGGMDGLIIVWEVAGGRELGVLEGHTGEIESLAFGPGSTLVSSAADATVQIWSADDAPPRRARGHDKKLLSIAFSPDRRTASSSALDFGVRLWRTGDGNARGALELGGWVHRGMAFSPDGKLLATGDHACALRTWDALTGTGGELLARQNDKISALAFSPDGSTLASGSWDASICLWTLAGDLEETSSGVPFAPIESLAFSPDGRLIAAAQGLPMVLVWDVKLGDSREAVRHDRADIQLVALSPDGALFASVSDDQSLTVWDAQTGKARSTLHGHTGEVESLSFSPDCALLASGGRDKTARVWDADTGASLTWLPVVYEVLAVSFDPASQLLYVADDGGPRHVPTVTVAELLPRPELR